MPSDSAKRFLDVTLAIIAATLLCIPLAVVYCLVRFTSRGPAIHWSKRVGINNALFMMAKFRTMRIDAPQVASHLMQNPRMYLTPIGGFLRKFSLDELPQLYNILRGDLSFVGPRPALFNQADLVALRTEKGVHVLKPGLTGWAQVNGRDELPIPVKVAFDEYYLHHQSLLFDIKIIVKTFADVIRGSGVSH